MNFFQPSFKLASKTRLGAKVRKTYHAPETPYARLLVCAAVTDEMKDRLRAVAVQLDPLRLLEEIRTVQHHLAALAAGETTHLPPRHEGSLDGFLAGLATAWQHGEVRATHRLAPRPARDWRTRKDPFERAWPCVRAWLEAEPDRVGKNSSRASRVNSLASSPMVNCGPFSAGSGSGATPPRGNSCSRRRPRTPHDLGRRRIGSMPRGPVGISHSSPGRSVQRRFARQAWA